MLNEKTWLLDRAAEVLSSQDFLSNPLPHIVNALAEARAQGIREGMEKGRIGGLEEQKAAWNLSQQLQKEVMRRGELEAENARLRKELERQRQGLQTILELRKIAGTDRYGALTRDEIKDVIMGIDAVLRTDEWQKSARITQEPKPKSVGWRYEEILAYLRYKQSCEGRRAVKATYGDICQMYIERSQLIDGIIDFIEMHALKEPTA